MTKKHFKELADGMRELGISNELTKNQVINMLCRFCKHFNSRFDEERFRAACEPTVKVKSAPKARGDSHRRVDDKITDDMADPMNTDHIPFHSNV